MKNKTNKLYAINTRIPIDLAEKMNSHLAITKQSASSFILDSVMEYLDLIYNKDYEPSKALKLNQYANELEKSLLARSVVNDEISPKNLSAYIYLAGRIITP